MGNVVIYGKEEKVFFSAANYYGANLRVDVFDDDAGEFIHQGVPMQEMIEPVADFNGTVSGDVDKDTKVITLNSTTGLNPSDRVEIDGEIYRVTKIDGNSITLHRGAIANIADGAFVTRVGNMGIFRIRLIVTRNGYFIIQAKDTKFGIQMTDSITVKEQSLEDMFEFTNREINENERVIKETSSWSIII